MQQVAERPDNQEMVVVHRVFRREYRLAPKMVAGVRAGDTARAAVIAAHLDELGGMLHHHHTGEDELVWPRLQERVAVSAELVARMETQHDRVARLMQRVDELLPQWRETADAAVRDDLAEVLAEASAALDEHLAEEEREVLPLVEQHMTVAEWAELGERGRAGMAKDRMLVLLGHILEDATPGERQVFLGHAPAPARVLYKLVGRRKWAREVAVLRQGISLPQQRQG